MTLCTDNVEVRDLPSDDGDLLVFGEVVEIISDDHLSACVVFAPGEEQFEVNEGKGLGQRNIYFWNDFSIGLIEVPHYQFCLFFKGRRWY